MPEDSSSWYARKMAAARQIPFGRQQQPVQQPQYQQPVSRYQEQPRQAPVQPTISATPETLSELLDMQKHGQALNPGKGARLNQEPCPNCGGSLYYADLGLKRRGPSPAPRCFTCGYNELFEQGLEANWQGGA